MRRRPKRMALVPETRGRALWVEEFMEDCLYQQDFQCLPVNPFVERLGCLNCNSETHETNDCILPSRFVFNRGSGEFARRLVLLRLRCNTASNPHYMLPYDYPLKGTVLHVDRKENCLYIRPQVLDDVCGALEYTLFQVRRTVLWPAAPSKINIGEVYLIRRQNSNVLARAVCGQMFFNWQKSTHWQMYLIDVGQTEFIDQNSIYLLPSELYSMPPMAIPVVLANCRVGYEAVTGCSVNHYAALNIGSTCIFALSSYYEGQPLSLSKGGYYPNFVNSFYPPPLLARVFRGTSLRDEIFCTWGLPDSVTQNRPICPLYCPSTFSFLPYTLENSPPVNLAVRVTEKIGQSHYWLRDAAICSYINKQIVLPTNGLWPYIEDNRSLACIARLQRPIRKRSCYYRAVASNFDNQNSRCTVFLIDYGQTLYCDVHDLFDLSDQPPSVLYTCGAAFKCTVSRANANDQENRAAKLATDEKYIIQVLGKENETSYIATVDVYIQADFQYPGRPPSTSNGTAIHPGVCNQPAISEEVNQSSDVSEPDLVRDMNYGFPEQDAMLATIRAQMSFNQEMANALKALDMKISLKLEQMSNRVDGLFSAVHSLQLISNPAIPRVYPSQHMYLYGDTQGTQQETCNRTSPPPAYDAKDMAFYGTHYQSFSQPSLFGQPPLCRYQTAIYPQQYIQQQPNIVLSNGRCYLHGYENHNCAYANHPTQIQCQRHIYTSHLNQQVIQRHTVDYIHQQQQQPPEQQRAVPGCTICSQQRDTDNQSSGSCSFCGAFMESRLRRSTSNHLPARQSSSSSRMNAARLHQFMHATAPDNLRRASTVSTNSSSTFDSSFKNSNTPSNAESQVSSRSSSPVDGELMNPESQGSRKSSDGGCIAVPETYASKAAGTGKTLALKKDTISASIAAAKRTNDKTERIEKSTKSDKGLESPKKGSKTQSQSLPQWLKKSERTVGTASSSKRKESDNAVNHAANSTLCSAQGKKSHTACPNANRQIASEQPSQQSATANKTNDEELYRNIPESCWICGKVGHLTRYCQSTPPAIWLFAQQMKKAQQKKVDGKPRDEKGRVLYTSDESSSDELDYDSDSDESLKQGKNINLDREIKLMSDDEEEFTMLKYKAYFGHITVQFGHKYAVTRSDDDIVSSLWPLFFVQIQSDECHQVLDAHLDSLDANVPLAKTEMMVGALCIAYCEQFDAKFRAVITAVNSDFIEVFYVDYGNYEWVKRSSLWSIADQNRTTMIQPGMAIPCILTAYDQERISSRKPGKDAARMKTAVSCGKRGFWLTFRKQRPDGICVVDVLDEIIINLK